MAAIIDNLNAQKKIYQVTFLPSKVDKTKEGVDRLMERIEEVANKAVSLKGQGEVSRVVVLFDGNSGNAGDADASLLKYIADKLCSMSSFLDVVDSLLIANPDTATTMLWKFCSSLGPFAPLKDRTRIIS